MISQYHIVHRLLKDEKFALEICSHFDPEFDNWASNDTNTPPPSKGMGVYCMIENEANRNFLITNTVLDKLSLLKIKGATSDNGIIEYDWSVFRNIPAGKYTFIIPNNQCLRMNIDSTCMHFIWFDMQILNKVTNKGHLNFHLFYVSKKDKWTPCEHFKSQNIQSIQETVFKILCFIYLSDVEEILLVPGQQKGTKKSGKIVNNLGYPLTVINSKWNITSIRVEGFPVAGHFAIRWTGAGRQEAKIVFIQPYEKNGYVRKAGIVR